VSRHYDPYRTKHPTIKSHLAIWKVISVAVFAKGKRRKEWRDREGRAYLHMQRGYEL
jgi:hypothetical protein